MRALKPEQQVRDYALKQHIAAAGETVLLNGRKIEALVSEIGGEEIFISGGTAEGADFRISIPQSAVAKEPAKFTTIEVRGNKSQVLQVTDINGVTWEIQAGDPTSGQR
jgi:hypothetical protein